MSVDYISAVNAVVSIYPQYEKTLADMERKKPFAYEDFGALATYLLFAKNGCYREMQSLSEKVCQIKDAEPLIDLAKKMQRAAAPIIFLCKEGEELIEQKKENPSVGPSIKHWLAMHLSDLNLAYFQLQMADKSDQATIQASMEKMKDAIGKICYFQDILEKKPEKIKESIRQLNQICEARINQVDKDGMIRKELKRGFWETVLVTDPMVLNLAAQIAILLTSSQILGLLTEQMGDSSLALMQLAFTAINLSHCVQTRKPLSGCMSATWLVAGMRSLYSSAYRA